MASAGAAQKKGLMQSSLSFLLHVSTLPGNRNNRRMGAGGYLVVHAGGFWVSEGPRDAFIGIDGHAFFRKNVG